MANVIKHGYALEAILKDADVEVDWDSDHLYDQLCAGIFLCKHTKKFWIDKKTNSYSFVLYARALSIAWSEDPQYWRWITNKEPCNTWIEEVAELVKVCWLDIRGTIGAAVLSPGIVYEVLFVIMIKKGACGWELPVYLELKKPDGSIQVREESLLKWPKEEWIQIPVGTFSLTTDDICCCSKVDFALYEHGDHWKTGLLVKSAIIKPVVPC